MRLRRLLLDGHRSVELLEFDAGPFTVLFGKNNAGKTNILETLYGVFMPDDRRVIRRTHAERPSNPNGAVCVELEPGISFDDQVSAAVLDIAPRLGPCKVAFTNAGVLAGDLDEYYDEDLGAVYPGNWRDDTQDAPSLHVLFLDWQFKDLHTRVEHAIEKLASSRQQQMRGDWPWLEMIQTTEERFAYRVPPATKARVEQLASLATDLLPDFVDGAIGAHVTASTVWGHMPKVSLDYDQRGLTQCADLVDAAGHGAARWMAAAVQIALHLMEEYPDLMAMRELGVGAFSRHVLLVDEPEAHLHPSAVASMVRWCQRMVRHGFTVIVASHHEEFLRVAGDDVTLVHVTRTSDLIHTSARTLLTTTVNELQDLAFDVGMHPASVLSLHRAILFVEGPLDEAVLDEYGGLKLDAVGVKIIPIHGTKNLEGLVSVELVSGLGVKIGILTDATDPATMAVRSGTKRSSEERKVLRVLQIAKEKGLSEPTAFGVREDDLLFALPPDAISEYLKGPFPGWKELVAECREASGKGPSDSVDWKSYAFDRYDLDIRTPAGVRDIVRKLDLADVELPSLRRVIDEVVDWARQKITTSAGDTGGDE
jgi:energy-coupling factor transporter ATP-binding protein EcfA2